MRAFLAIEPGEETLEALEFLQQDIPVGRLVAPGAMHLTLAFLDDQPEDRLEDLHFKLETLTPPSFDVIFDGLGTFGGDRPRVVFAVVEQVPALMQLRRTVVQAARGVGMNLPRETYRPHVTLARLRHDLSDEAHMRLQDFLAAELLTAIPPFRAHSMTLMQSQLHPDGARHEPLTQYPLR